MILEYKILHSSRNGFTSLIGGSHLRREGESVRLDEGIDNLTIYIYVFG